MSSNTVLSNAGLSSSTGPSSTGLRRPLLRVGLPLLAAGAAVFASSGAALAHVTVQPGSTEGGGFSVVAFRVPNERDDASTTKLRVILPKDKPIGSVSTTPIPGWKASTKTRHLAKPIEMEGEKVSDVVSQVTWTSTSGGIAPGQFQDFDLSLGPLPDSGKLVFKALQTYSTGEQVNWTEVSLDDSVEPEHPAPVLSLTAPAAGTEQTAADGPAQSDTAKSDTVSDSAPVARAADDTGSGSALPLAISVVALVVSLGSAAFSRRRGKA
jgi:uncharacterized protein YcnI